jgi:hypothetical protein
MADSRRESPVGRRRVSRFSLPAAASVLAIGLGLSGAVPTEKSAAAGSPGMTRSYVVTYFYGVISPNSEKDDCPKGFAKAPDPADYFKDLTPTQLHDLETSGAQRGRLAYLMDHRGPGGRGICENPTLEPASAMPVGQSKIGYGLHLDGANAANAPLCAHEEMTSPDGVQHVDNQLERLSACIQQRRSNGYLPSYELALMHAGEFTLLIQVSGIHDLKNDDNVKVTVTSSVDPLVFAPDGETPLQFASYTLSQIPKYTNVLAGRIKDGVLETEPHDIVLPSNEFRKEETFRDAQLSLVFQPNGTLKGLLGGYKQLDEIYRQLAWDGALGESIAGPYSCSAFYNAMHALADGFPDPKTGRCTAISSATKIEAIPAFAVPPPRRTTSASAKPSPQRGPA